MSFFCYPYSHSCCICACQSVYFVVSNDIFSLSECCNSEHGQPIRQSSGVVIQCMAPAAAAGKCAARVPLFNSCILSCR